MRDLPPSRLALVALAALLPWSWFLLRNVLSGVGDVIAIVLPVLALLVAGVLALVGIRRRLAWLAAASTLLMAAVAVLGPWTPADAGSVLPGQGITVAGANIDDRTQNLDFLTAVRADVLVVEELPAALDVSLAPRFPYHVAEPGSGPNVGVYSRLPIMSMAGSGPDLPGIRVELAGPSGPVVLYALHVPRPWFSTSTSPTLYQATVTEHRRLIAEVARRVAAETVPTVVLGDLNASDRSSDYRVLLDDGGLVDAMRDGWVGPTSVTKWAPLLLRIDHLMVKPGWCGDAARTFPLDSSHRGITAVIGPCQP